MTRALERLAGGHPLSEHTFLDFRVVWPHAQPKALSEFVYIRRPDFSAYFPPGGGMLGSSGLVKYITFKPEIELATDRTVYRCEPPCDFITSQHIKDVPGAGVRIHVYPTFVGFWEQGRSKQEIEAMLQDAQTEAPHRHREVLQSNLGEHDQAACLFLLTMLFGA